MDKKLNLAIAIRLKCEEFLIEEINERKFVEAIKGNQTIKLIKKYKEKYSKSDKKKQLKIIKKVGLITPCNIHINSFMYEPILDMDLFELKNLYIKVKALRNNKEKNIEPKVENIVDINLELA